MAQIVEAADWRDTDGTLSWAPSPAPPVVEVEVAAFGGGEQERCRAPRRRKLVKRVESGVLERHGAGGVRLGGLEAVDAEGSADVDEALLAVDVAMLERDPLSGSQAGGGGEQGHRSVARSEFGGERLELAVGVERVHLAAWWLRVVDAGLGGVGVEKAPLDGARESLPERLGRFEAVSGRERHPPGGDLSSVELV